MNRTVAACGNDCAACPRYVVPPCEKTEEELEHTAELWARIGYRDRVVSCAEISCTGCKPTNRCRYRIASCCEERKITTCAACAAYPCATLRECLEVTASFEPRCRQVLSKAGYDRLRRAFFRKQENLETLRSEFAGSSHDR